MRWAMISAALVLGGCATSSSQDATMQALFRATPLACPADQIGEAAQPEGFAAPAGLAETEIARVPLSGGRGVLRTRRVMIEPGGVIPWHSHAARQGTAIILEGEMTEYSNGCRGPLVYRPGDAVREVEGLQHALRNEGAAPAVIFAVDVLPE